MVLAIAVAALAVAPIGWAQTDHSTVIRVLRGSSDFRARTRAALALGSSNDRTVVPQLIGALRDEHPAVRAAAATGLGRLGDPTALSHLRAAVSDQERIVRTEAQRAIRRIEEANRGQMPTGRRRGRERMPEIAVVPRAREIYWPRVRYVVIVGQMENRSNFGDDALGRAMLAEVNRNLLVLRGVAALPDGRIPEQATREIQRRRLPKLRLEGSLNRVERESRRRQVSVRCEVSLMLMDDEGRNLRGVLNGAATGSQPQQGRRRDQEEQLAQQALVGAVRSAMSGAARAISSAGAR